MIATIEANVISKQLLANAIKDLLEMTAIKNYVLTIVR